MKYLLFSMILLTCCIACNNTSTSISEKKINETTEDIKPVFQNKALLKQIIPDEEEGKILFKKNCAACHTLNKKNSVGPGLVNIQHRIPYDDKNTWLANYILNCNDTNFSKQSYVINLKSEYKNSSPMPVYLEVLTEQEAVNISTFLIELKLPNE